MLQTALLSEAFLASVEKDAKERAKRRRESRVLADGNCLSLRFSSWDDWSGKAPMKVCVLMHEDTELPRGYGGWGWWWTGKPEDLTRQNPLVIYPLFLLNTGHSLSQHPQVDWANQIPEWCLGRRKEGRFHGLAWAKGIVRKKSETGKGGWNK